jgi:ABC-type bacteriocin/lantibiotic exporter with double-glycine peptidase domain
LSGLSLLTVWVTRQAIGRALPEQASSLLAALVVAVAAGSCINAWLGWLRARTRITLDVELVRAVNVAVLRRVLALPYAEHQRRGLGRLLQVLESSEVAARQVAGIVGDSFDAFAALGYLLALTACAPWMGVALAGFVVFSAAGTLLLSNRSARLRTEELNHATRARARLHELIQGVATLKVGHAEAYGIRTWLQELVRERGTGLSRELTDAWLRVFGEAIQRIASVSVLLFGARAVLMGELGIADLVYLSMLTAGFMHSSMGVTRAFSSMWLAWTHLVRVGDLLSVPPAPAPFLAAQRTVARVGPAIELSDVWFRHGPDQPWILKGYNLTVDRNEHFELRGETGSGKTTILRLIAGLYRPERGTVSVLGKDPWRDRSAVAYLPQHARLFAGSLRHSLQQLSGASIEPIVSACSKTRLTDWLITLPMGLETLVAPGGNNISGGQRQWVVLTAAVASERPIVLLDEAMSQIDYAVRRALSEADLFAGRTSVSVAHDS